MRGFIKVTLNDEDLVAGSGVTTSIFICEKVPTRKQFFRLRSYLKIIRVKYILANNYTVLFWTYRHTETVTKCKMINSPIYQQT